MRVAGVIEGFYGEPWSHAERLELIRFCGREGFDLWVHAPKDDPFHRRRWRDPYPEGELGRIAELVREAERAGLRFAYALAPGLDLEYTSDADFAAALAKCEQLRDAGVRSFQLLWDDVEHDLRHASDRERYGGEERPSAAAQAPWTNRFAREVEQDGPLVVCPMGYAGTGDSPYRRIFSERLDEGVVVYWTGPEVVSVGISREALDRAQDRFRGRTLLVWDNYPVNDFDPGRLFLGPLLGRDPRLLDDEVSCAGLVANAMVQAIPSKLALATVADWCRDPHGYDPLESFERALREHGAEVVSALQDLSDADVHHHRPGAADVHRHHPDDIARLAAALGPGVDPGTAVTLLEPFV